MTVYYKRNTLSTYFGHSCGQPEGGALQKMDTSILYKVCDPVHRCKILYFNNTWLEIHIKIARHSRLVIGLIYLYLQSQLRNIFSE